MHTEINFLRIAIEVTTYVAQVFKVEITENFEHESIYMETAHEKLQALVFPQKKMYTPYNENE